MSKLSQARARAHRKSNTPEPPKLFPVRRWALTGAVFFAIGMAGTFWVRREVLAGSIGVQGPTGAETSVKAPPGGLRTLPKGFEMTKANAAKPAGPAPDGMVWIPGGEYSMGSDDPTTSLCGGEEG